MRTTKVMSFSAPPEFEAEIQTAAKSEHRTISEFIREAVRQYIVKKNIEATRSAVKSQGLSERDV